MPQTKKNQKISSSFQKSVRIHLYGSNLDEYLQCGLGGLAFALSELPPDSLEKYGSFEIKDHEVILDWSKSNPFDFFHHLFSSVFSINPKKILNILGTYRRNANNEEIIAVHKALLNTFFIHRTCYYSSKKNKNVLSQQNDGNVEHNFYNPIEKYILMPDFYPKKEDNIWYKIAECFYESKNIKSIKLNSWAYPGKYEEGIFKQSYTVEQAICASFASIGSLAFYSKFQKAGILIIPVPTNLNLFIEYRKNILQTPLISNYFINSSCDAILNLKLYTYLDDQKEENQGPERLKKAAKSISYYYVITFESTSYFTNSKIPTSIDSIFLDDIPLEKCKLYKNLIESFFSSNSLGKIDSYLVKLIANNIFYSRKNYSGISSFILNNESKDNTIKSICIHELLDTIDKNTKKVKNKKNFDEKCYIKLIKLLNSDEFIDKNSVEYSIICFVQEIIREIIKDKLKENKDSLKKNICNFLYRSKELNENNIFFILNEFIINCPFSYIENKNIFEKNFKNMLDFINENKELSKDLVFLGIIIGCYKELKKNDQEKNV
ncbi:MAG: type I-MYXAN CRISPR-associated Cas8a1/Cmx1 [Candidatus Dojkabacteria bacterium]|nr:type I-MYXAN CRISPR-associated Cas8a1/Cmx1 [Candidatus Dojkabacteria bacterium]